MSTTSLCVNDAHDNAERRLPPAQRITVAEGTGPLAGTESQPSKLAEALATARERCKAVAKSSENTFHKYKYASADAIIAEATEAMNSTGLSLVPLSKRLRAVAMGSFAYHELEQRLLLIHPSGESVPLEINWPVCPDKGRPLDKAMAIADTSSLAYLLRDLLLMPRVNPQDEMHARDDRPAPEAPPAAEPSPPAASSTPAAPSSPATVTTSDVITLEQYDELTKLMAEAKTDHQRFCAHYHIKGVLTLPAQHFHDARGKLLANLKPTSEQADRIDALCAALKLDKIAAEKKLREFLPEARSFTELNRLQAGIVIDAIAKTVAVKGAK
jgi:hypothetical protein